MALNCSSWKKWLLNLFLFFPCHSFFICRDAEHILCIWKVIFWHWDVTQFVLLDKFYMFQLLCQQLIRSSFGVLTMRKGRGPVVSYFFSFSVFCFLFCFCFCVYFSVFVCVFFFKNECDRKQAAKQVNSWNEVLKN